MHPAACIQVDTETWIVMREYPQQPKAIIHRITDTGGEARYMLMTWHAERSRRRMVGIHPELQVAIDAVPWPSTKANTPPIPKSMRNPAPHDTGPRHRAELNTDGR